MAQEQTVEFTRRILLHNTLLTFADHVYFQAPTNTNMQYPCIVYSIDDDVVFHADDQPYHLKDRYQVMVIGKDPDTPIRRQIASLPVCRFDRHYVADNLHHYVFNLFF